MVYSKITTPICDAIKLNIKKAHVRGHTPGHQNGAHIPQILNEWDESVWQWDLTELPGLDNLLNPTGVIAEAERLAADLYGVSKTFFLTQGSTAGIQAAVLATVRPGDKILIPRHCHVAVWNALILSGADPIWLNPEYDDWGLVQPTSPEAVQRCLDENKDVVAVLLQNPTYEGQSGDIAELVRIVHGSGLPIIIDEAHGAHWHFSDYFPLSAVDAGADIIIQSAHKTLPVLTGGAWLHCGNRVCTERIRASLRLIHSTSPSYLILASLDACRDHLESNAKREYLEFFQMMNEFYRQLPEFKYLKIRSLALKKQDFSKLNIHIMIENIQAWVNIIKKYGIMLEKQEGRNMLFLTTPGIKQLDLMRLLAALKEFDESISPADAELHNFCTTQNFVGSSQFSLAPREVFFLNKVLKELKQAIGSIAAEAIMLYPPGVPMVIPGEVITRELIDYLYAVKDVGTMQGLLQQGHKLYIFVVQ